MASYNRVLLVGNLTRDPDVRYTPKGTAVAEIGLAVNRVYSTDSGEKREEVTFVDITLWGRQAEIAGEYLKKGRPVLIEGRLQMDTWDDKQTGQKRSKLKVVAENMQLLGGGGQGGSGGAGRGEEGSGESYEGGGGGGGNSGGGYQRREAPREPRSGGEGYESRGTNNRPQSKGPPRPPQDPDLEPPEEDDIPF